MYHWVYYNTTSSPISSIHQTPNTASTCPVNFPMILQRCPTLATPLFWSLHDRLSTGLTDMRTTTPVWARPPTPTISRPTINLQIFQIKPVTALTHFDMRIIVPRQTLLLHTALLTFGISFLFFQAHQSRILVAQLVTSHCSPGPCDSRSSPPPVILHRQTTGFVVAQAYQPHILQSPVILRQSLGSRLVNPDTTPPSICAVDV
jgi:hypothetical protein